MKTSRTDPGGRDRPRWRRRTIAGVGTVAALCINQGGTAAATNDWGANPDNPNHYIGHFSSGWDANGDAAESRGGSELDRSDLIVHYGNTGDVKQLEGDFRQHEWYGITSCDDLIVSTCDHYTVYYDSQNIADDYSGSYRTAAFKALGCHELGHTGGLDEESNQGATTCMVAGLEITKQSLRDPHDLTIINDDIN